jgi:hypothetical protein
MAAPAKPMSAAVKPVLRLDFCDFNGVNKADNWFTRILRRAYTVEITDRPDLLIFQEGGHLNRLYTCRKLFWTGESIRPDWSRTDYALTCHHLDHPRHLRFPYYVFGAECAGSDLVKAPDEADRIVAERRKFCAVMVSNAGSRTSYRNQFIARLDARQRVDSGGTYRNTIGGPIPRGGRPKHAFIRQYKFNLCYENKALDGYTTEKLVEAMWARCIPIYWGNPRVGEEFNLDSMLCRHAYPDDATFIDRILEVDRDEARYRALLAQPFFHDNRPNAYYSDDRLLAFFDRILSDRSRPVSQRQRFWHPGRWRLAKRMHFTATTQ